jgi:hypothetical protein
LLAYKPELKMLKAFAELRIRNSPISETLETTASLTGALLRIM